MKEVMTFTPARLQAQAVLTQNALGSGRFGSGQSNIVPDDLLQLVKRASNKPGLIQRAMAYTIPTSQLPGLIPLLAYDDDVVLQQTAQRLLCYRMRPRLADPVWQHLQCQPERLIYSELMLTLARDILAAHHGRIASDLDPSVELAARTLAAHNGDPLPAATFAEAIRHYLVQHACCRYPVADVLKRFRLNLSSAWVRDLLIETFSQANDTSLIMNTAVLVQWLSLSAPMPWVVINHYGETLQSERWDDRVGRLVEQALYENAGEPDSPGDPQVSERLRTIAAKSVLSPLAARRFFSWRKLDSLRRLLVVPRQIELLSRFYYLFLEPAQMLTLQTVVIHLPRLVIVLRRGEPHFYLYPSKLFAETLTRRLEKAMIEANLAAGQPDPAAADAPEADEEAAPAPEPADPDLWPIEQALVIPARQALLNEQDKHLDERSLVDELVNNEKVSIIQLFLDDAHYLFARKIFEEIAFFEGLRPD
ncbi:MAG: hypothetical protein PHQ83_11060 [Eubacteriales bacterium]|nr:hypothetical protein [Eubacteriales bacterium]